MPGGAGGPWWRRVGLKGAVAREAVKPEIFSSSFHVKAKHAGHSSHGSPRLESWVKSRENNCNKARDMRSCVLHSHGFSGFMYRCAKPCVVDMWKAWDEIERNRTTFRPSEQLILSKRSACFTACSECSLAGASMRYFHQQESGPAGLDVSRTGQRLQALTSAMQVQTRTDVVCLSCLVPEHVQCSGVGVPFINLYILASLLLSELVHLYHPKQL